VEEDLRNSKDLAGEVRLAGVAVTSRFRAPELYAPLQSLFMRWWKICRSIPRGALDSF
jgi:hypothetical protein